LTNVITLSIDSIGLKSAIKAAHKLVMNILDVIADATFNQLVPEMHPDEYLSKVRQKTLPKTGLLGFDS